VGRDGRSHHENLVQAARLGELPGHGYVTVMDRVEGAAEDADFFHSDSSFVL
jgi:hypothetical protein